jgi:hypothetical protein
MSMDPDGTNRMLQRQIKEWHDITQQERLAKLATSGPTDGTASQTHRRHVTPGARLAAAVRWVSSARSRAAISLRHAVAGRRA